MDKQTGRILIVDDETSMRELLQIMLQREGYQVDSAEKTEEDLGLAVVPTGKKRIEKRIDFTFLCCKFHTYGEPSITSHTPKR